MAVIPQLRLHEYTDHSIALYSILAFLAYLILVRCLRYRRAEHLERTWESRPLSTMTSHEAHTIITHLQTLEFPFAFTRARSIALLKAGALPTMSKLFFVTGQNNARNARKRVRDTEILLREAQSQHPESERYMEAVARMNYLHERYRRARKILDADMLHTLGDGMSEVLRCVDGFEWRGLSEVERCAVGVFHRDLGEDMDIPFEGFLPSAETGWRDGAHFAEELREWTRDYEERNARWVQTGETYVRTYVSAETLKIPAWSVRWVRRVLGGEMDDTMREALGLEKPGWIFSSLLRLMFKTRQLALRYLALPRPSWLAVQIVGDAPDPSSSRPPALLKRRIKKYDIKAIGPRPQEGKGLEEMQTTVEFLRSRGSARCPFSSGTDASYIGALRKVHEKGESLA